MKLVLKATMLVISILFLAVSLYMYHHVSVALRLTAAAALPRAIASAGGYVGSSTLAGLCFVTYALLRRERDAAESSD